MAVQNSCTVTCRAVVLCGMVEQKGFVTLGSVPAFSFGRCEPHLLGLIKEITQNRTIMRILRRQDSGRSMGKVEGWAALKGVMPEE